MYLAELSKDVIKRSHDNYNRIVRLTAMMDMENVREFFADEFGEILFDSIEKITAKYDNIIIEFLAVFGIDSSFDDFGGKAVISENIKIVSGELCSCTWRELLEQNMNIKN